MKRDVLLRTGVALGLGLAVAVLYGPVLGFQLTGDDYQMAQFAHQTLLHPSLALAPLGQFFRPLTNWSFVADRLLWGTNPAGYHATTLLFHALAAVSLLGAGLRLGLSLPWAGTVALLWIVAPFTDENAVWAAIRHQSFLMILWMALVMLWPRAARTERWTKGRLATGITVVAALALTKESWVMTPALAMVLDMTQKGRSFRAALRPAMVLAFPAAVYVALRFAFIPTTGGYFELSPAPLLKVPHMLAAFLWLEELRPLAFRPTLAAVLGVAAVLGLGWIGLRRKIPAVRVGMALLFVPLLPVLLVPYLPQRYTAIPWAGFLLMMAGLLQAGFRSAGGWRSRALGLGSVLAAAALLAAGISVIRADLKDWRAVSDAHRTLLEEARAAAPAFPRDRPVVLVRAERESPLLAISGKPKGLYKLWFQRNGDPYGLIDGAALFDWVLDLPGAVVENRGEAGGGDCRGAPEILAHLAGGFRWLPASAMKGEDPTGRWRQQGFPVKEIGIVPCGGGPDPR